MVYWVQDVYPKLPVFAQNLACSLYGAREARLRFDKVFERTLEWLLESEHWTAGEIENYQNERLRILVHHAYDTVPYYRDRMKSLKLAPSDIRTRADLYKLPILTKDDVRQNMDRLVSTAASKSDLIQYHTSGTTGSSLHFLVTRPSVAFRWAVWWRHRRRFGVNVDDWHANFTGKLVIPPAQMKGPYWRWNYPMHQILLTMHHMVPEKVVEIAQFLSERNLVYYSGYPSIIHAFARSLMDTGTELKAKPKFVFTGAENVLANQRADITKVTGAVLSTQYGFAEGCGNASHCPELVYHEDFEYGLLECVDPVTDDQGRTRGKIVATGFASPGFPFIRYEVGDIGLWAPPNHRCCCGRRSPVILEIEGRMDDYVVTPEGRRIMRFDYLFKDTGSVKECQVVQRRAGEIVIRVVRRPSYSGADEAMIRGEVAKWISPRLKVEFEYVNEIERASNGKFRAVKSELIRSQPDQSS